MDSPRALVTWELLPGCLPLSLRGPRSPGEATPWRVRGGTGLRLVPREAGGLWLEGSQGASLVSGYHLQSLAPGDSTEILLSPRVMLILSCFELLVASWKPRAQLINRVCMPVGIKIS